MELNLSQVVEKVRDHVYGRVHGYAERDRLNQIYLKIVE